MVDPQQKRRQRLLEVGKRHFEKYGYKRTVIDDIVREAGISKGTFYLHFKSKKEMYLEIIEEMRQRNLRDFQALIEAPREPADKLAALMRLTLERVYEEPILMRMTADESDRWVVDRLMAMESVRSESDLAVEALQKVIRDGIESGQFRPDLNEKLLPFVLGLFKLMPKYFDYLGELDYPGSEEVGPESLTDSLVDLVLHGVKAR